MTRTALRAASLAALALSTYVVMGVVSREPVRDHLQERCQPAPSAGAHVALWPIVIATLPSRSQC